jgi:hypothetical protein
MFKADGNPPRTHEVMEIILDLILELTYVIPAQMVRMDPKQAKEFQLKHGAAPDSECGDWKLLDIHVDQYDNSVKPEIKGEFWESSEWDAGDERFEGRSLTTKRYYRSSMGAPYKYSGGPYGPCFPNYTELKFEYGIQPEETHEAAAE